MRKVYTKEWYHQYYENNREVIAAKRKAYNKTPVACYAVYRKNAKIKNVPFDLTFDEFKTFWQKPCVVGCAIETIGLDRINNSKGYEITNVRPMCRKHNYMKNKYSDEELITLADALRGAR